MEKVRTVGLDITKHVFQTRGVNAFGAVGLRRKLRRDDVAGYFKGVAACLIAIDGCATAHHWALVSLECWITRLGSPA